MSAKDKLSELDSTVKETHKKQVEALRRSILENELKEQEARYQDALLKHKNSRFKKDETGETISDWEASSRAAKRSASSEAAAYNSEWKMCMLNLISTYSKMAEAIGNSVKEHFTMPVSERLKRLYNRSFNDRYSDLDLLPVFIHEVNLNEDDVLEVKLFKKNSPQNSFNDNFREAVVLWLEEKGYFEDLTQKGKFKNTNGQRLTKEQFNELKPQFNEFLTSNSVLSYESSIVDEPPVFRP